MAKTVRDAMTPNVRAAAPGDSVADVAQAMKEEDVGSLPVVQEGRLMGIVTDRDIVVRAVAERRDPQAVIVDDVASRDPVTVEPEQDLDDALVLMAQHRVRRLPVVENGPACRHARAGGRGARGEGEEGRRDGRGDLAAGVAATVVTTPPDEPVGYTEIRALPDAERLSRAEAEQQLKRFLPAVD